MKIAVILFNLGGPDSLKAVKPFLFNLFYDPAIISLPNPFRWMLAKFIAWRRTSYAKKIYEKMGGKSPINDETLLQVRALEKALKPLGNFKVFHFMRYWKPFADDVAKEVKKYDPQKIILLPLYPQYSTTTTSSSFKLWQQVAKRINLNAETKVVCCYYNHPEFIASYANLIAKEYKKGIKLGNPRILFSAHGIPLNRIKKGDPYQFQVEQTVKAIVQRLSIDGLDYVICYQSKVGPLEWLTPATDQEILKAAKEKKPIVVAPISFVSEHSETLVELDIDYKELATANGCPYYLRVPTVRSNKLFIDCLKQLCIKNNAKKCKILENGSCMDKLG